MIAVVNSAFNRLANSATGILSFMVATPCPADQIVFHALASAFAASATRLPDAFALSAMASAAGAAAIGGEFSRDRVWVIGDTVHDVTCGQSIGAKTLAVATGGHVASQLTSVGPDLLLPDLGDTRPWLAMWTAGLA